uniref:Uncharacterized protein n=1 Tax=Anguilla anguilla TaxID=7936 RepID=A0A0E9XPW5_ANGAN
MLFYLVSNNSPKTVKSEETTANLRLCSKELSSS